MSMMPVPSALTRPFWDAAKAHKLVRPVCQQCRKSFFTPQIACPRCHTEMWDWEASSGRGKVYSSVVVHRPPDPGFSVPYILAIVTLDEEWSMLSNIVNCPINEPLEDRSVRVCWGKQLGEFTIPCFELVRD